MSRAMSSLAERQNLDGGLDLPLKSAASAALLIAPPDLVLRAWTVGAEHELVAGEDDRGRLRRCRQRGKGDFEALGHRATGSL